MHSLIYRCGFGGAWLLVSGPVYQASVELRAEGEASARSAEVMSGAPEPEPVSNWWWLLRRFASWSGTGDGTTPG